MVLNCRSESELSRSRFPGWNSPAGQWYDLVVPGAPDQDTHQLIHELARSRHAIESPASLMLSLAPTWALFLPVLDSHQTPWANRHRHVLQTKGISVRLPTQQHTQQGSVVQSVLYRVLEPWAFKESQKLQSRNTRQYLGIKTCCWPE